MGDMHCFSFVMMYGLSSNNVLYSTSNWFLYVNKNLLHFLNVKQQFSFKNWFVFIPRFIGSALGKMKQKMSKTRGCPGYINDCLLNGSLNLLYTILWTIVLRTKFDMYNSSYVFLFYLLFRCTVVDFWTIIYWTTSLSWC